MTFSAIDPVHEKTIESPMTRRVGSTYQWWGEKNTYPQMLEELGRTSATLRAVILGTTDYICGNAVNALHGLNGTPYVDGKRTTWAQFIRKTGNSVSRLGGFAWGVIRNGEGAVIALEVIPLKYIRTDEDNTTFWYNEKWGKGSKVTEYPAWTPDTKLPYSVFFCKVWGDEIYPEPVYAAAIKEAATEAAISDFHLGNIERGFMGSYIVNFNNGRPTPEILEEIERNFNQKFAGHANAGRMMFSWNPNVQSRTTLEKMEVADYGEKYATLSKHCRQQIFTSFRANPNLFGVPTENNGFNSEEYDSAFRLFNRTMVQPIQAAIIDGIEAVLGEKGIVTIEPFTLDGAEKEVE